MNPILIVSFILSIFPNLSIIFTDVITKLTFKIKVHCYNHHNYFIDQYEQYNISSARYE